MGAIRIRRSLQTLGLATVIAALPMFLLACSASSEDEAHTSELRAANGSDVLGLPTASEYEVTAVELTQPELAALTGFAEPRSSGGLTLTDGVITEATLSVDILKEQQLRFALSDPVVLRRAGGAGETVHAMGTLTLSDADGSAGQYGTEVELTPRFNDDDTAEFDVEIELPEHLLSPISSDKFSAVADEFDTIAATVSFTAIH